MTSKDGCALFPRLSHQFLLINNEQIVLEPLYDLLVAFAKCEDVAPVPVHVQEQWNARPLS